LHAGHSALAQFREGFVIESAAVCFSHFPQASPNDECPFYIALIDNFWKAVARGGETGEGVVTGFANEELAAARGTESDFMNVCLLPHDENVVRRIGKASGLRHADRMDTRWLHLRQFQTWALHGLVLCRRCQHAGGAVSEHRLEHDLQHLEYLMLGMHAGSLATNDISQILKKTSLGWRFETLNPLGHLLTPASIRED
jgi:hypothetical protein